MSGAIPPTDRILTTPRRGFCIQVYDTPEWRSNVLGALKLLSYGYYWDRTLPGWEDAKAEGLHIALSYMEHTACDDFCRTMIDLANSSDGDIAGFLAAILAKIAESCAADLIEIATTAINNLLYPAIELASTDCGVSAQMQSRGQVGNTIDLSACVAAAIRNSQQPGDNGIGGTIPPDTCYERDVILAGNQRYLIPYPVTDGWQLTVTNATGAWSYDPSFLTTWFCYDGHEFDLGVCGGLQRSAQSGSPVMSAHRMALVVVYPSGTDGLALVDGTEVTIPDGTGSGNYFLTANDSDITNNPGGITFHLKVCSPVAHINTLGCGVVDFTASDGGFSLLALNDSVLTGYPSGEPTADGMYLMANGWESSALCIGFTGHLLLAVGGDFAAPLTLSQVAVTFRVAGNGGIPNHGVLVKTPGNIQWVNIGGLGGESVVTPGTVVTETANMGNVPYTAIGVLFRDYGGNCGAGWDTNQIVVTGLNVICT